MLTETQGEAVIPRKEQSLLKRMLRIDWLGQMMASLFWVASVFVYSIAASGNWLPTAAGDWLQLLAASAWMIANIAALVASGSDA